MRKPSYYKWLEGEVQLVREHITSDAPELIYIYGSAIRCERLFVVHQATGSQYAFAAKGVLHGTDRMQRAAFIAGLKRPDLGPMEWKPAFDQLKKHLEVMPAGNKVVLLDEAQHMGQPKSEFIPALGHFWNTWACQRTDVKVVLSSTRPWMLNRVLGHSTSLRDRHTLAVEVKARKPQAARLP